MDVAIRNNSFLGHHGKVQFPLIPGHEFYGEVQELGSKVRKLTKGDRVATSAIKGCGKRRACQKGIYNRCQNRDHVGIDAQGSFAEYICIAEDILFPVTAAIEMTAPGNLFLMGGSGFRGESVSFKPWNVVRDEKQIKGLHGFSMDDYLTVLDLYNRIIAPFQNRSFYEGIPLPATADTGSVSDMRTQYPVPQTT